MLHPMNDNRGLPLDGLRVLDFGHTVMGPTAGLVLADLGAEVIRIEPTDGDPTRRLKGFGTGYFPFYNRNKKSLALDLKTDQGRDIVIRLIGTSDVLIENFGPGTMARLRLDYDGLREDFPRLVYLSLKGFLPGPYEHRVALDEVVQMMSGLAYMTGPPGQPLRAGASVIDVMGGVMGVIGVQAALAEREKTGRGQLVTSALFESAAFLMGQHLAYAALSTEPVPPMPARVSAWAIYDQFDAKGGDRVFLGITSDRHWERFCKVFGDPALGGDARYLTNNQRIEERGTLLPRVAGIVASHTLSELTKMTTEAKLPFAHIARPEDLFTDPHLEAGGRLLRTQLPGGVSAMLPGLPFEVNGRATRKNSDPPGIGADTREVLTGLGLSDPEIAGLARDGIIVMELENA